MYISIYIFISIYTFLTKLFRSAAPVLPEHERAGHIVGHLFLLFFGPILDPNSRFRAPVVGDLMLLGTRGRESPADCRWHHRRRTLSACILPSLGPEREYCLWQLRSLESSPWAPTSAIWDDFECHVGIHLRSNFNIFQKYKMGNI